ncbi:Winged helix DNA-binding domain superfamily [Arabidopsis thaliana x Arabidopsis arenosa]|uniref:ADP-ribosyl cyclase/cyclic ADP-ribose hydrolase n=1 Tax=Arabidopsis thaliana x Arabidopsis arenosa TaxID=1240361 RepID=A0A8T2BD91_9BRAS|nr:Winged helix DNA-binding domain superfamily [Arabidopsis thaliana x Arabidopsis arenosa]
MASSSPRTWRYRFFASFHGPDVRKTFMNHLRKQFSCNGITMFDDQGIERSKTIAPALKQAIWESRISIVVLSKKYASSSWCLNELLEIFKCKEVMGQIVMTIFYGVDPSDVRKQTGDFGTVFKEISANKTEEERQRWSQALNDVGNIAGEHSLNWDNESKMIEKIARDVSNKLNTTISRDFEDMVGLEAHLEKMKYMLHIDCENEAMIVGICGPAGIGKTTIARALHSLLSSSVQLSCFMVNLRGSYNSGLGLDEYGLKLCLQEQLLSKILNQNGMSIYHLGAIPERLCDQKVLIILDDVDNLKQLEALANDTNWFGPGSRIIVTTEDQEILKQHGINNTYHVGFPSREEALKIFCRYAFRQSSPPNGYEKLPERIAELCSNLPLGLRVMGSSLRGKNEKEWEVILHRLENSLDRDIEGVLRVGYNSLHKNDQSLFLYIAFFFNYKDDDYVMAMLADSDLEVELGLKILAYKSLIQISTEGKIVMHKLLQQVGRQVVQRQKPWKRQILIDARGICDVLETDYGGRSVMGISLDRSTILDGEFISSRALKRMHNLQFLRIYKTRFDTKDNVHVPKDIDLPPRLRLLHWEVYPGKCLPRTFTPAYLVELDLLDNQLEKLWEGIQPLTNLKEMALTGSWSLKELPDLSNATKLERLDLSGCKSLVEIPSSFGNLHKLKWLQMIFCIKLQVVPAHFNLASLEMLDMMGCSQLRKFPYISTNITTLTITDTMLEEVSESIRLLSRLQSLRIFGSVNTFPYVGGKFQERTSADIDKIPDCLKYLQGLQQLYIGGCPKIASLPELPSLLKILIVENCASLETVSFPLDTPSLYLFFQNCFKLGQEERRIITTQSLQACLPGRQIPVEFAHGAIGNSLTILSNCYGFRFCVVLSPKKYIEGTVNLLCRIRLIGCPIDENIVLRLPIIQADHLFISHSDLFGKGIVHLELEKEILFEFRTTSRDIEVIECGVHLLMDKTYLSRVQLGKQ